MGGKVGSRRQNRLHTSASTLRLTFVHPEPPQANADCCALEWRPGCPAQLPAPAIRCCCCCCRRYEVDSFEQLAGADARKVILFLAVMAVHAVGEGGGVGVSFAGDRGWAQVRKACSSSCNSSSDVIAAGGAACCHSRASGGECCCAAVVAARRGSECSRPLAAAKKARVACIQCMPYQVYWRQASATCAARPLFPWSTHSTRSHAD
jgi:hypothetical protein